LRGVLHGAVALGVWGNAPCKAVGRGTRSTPGNSLAQCAGSPPGVGSCVLFDAWHRSNVAERSLRGLRNNQTVVSPTRQGGQAGAARRDGAVKPPLDLSKGHKPPLNPLPPCKFLLDGSYDLPTFCFLGPTAGGGPVGVIRVDYANSRTRGRYSPFVPKGEARRCYQHATGLWRPTNYSLIERMQPFYGASRGHVTVYA